MQDSENLTDALDTLLHPRHRWYFVKESFSPKLVKKAIEECECQKDDLVIDVFCGGGTTTLAAAMEGYDTAGFEVNPFLAFVARTKMVNCRANTFYNQVDKVIDACMKGKVSRLSEFSTFSENERLEKWLFNRDILFAFEGGWKSAQNIYAPVKTLLRLCLIGAAMDVCNAVRDGKCLRYRDDWRELNFTRDDFLQAVRVRTLQVKQDLEAYPILSRNVEIYNADSRTLSSAALNGRQFKLCVTSPPYLNSFDYTDIYRPELFLSKSVKSQAQLYELRLNTLRSHVQAKWDEPDNEDLSPLLMQSVSEIQERHDKLWNDRIPVMIQAYFEDMKKIFMILKSLAAKEANLWITVANSAYTGVEVPVDLIIANIGSSCGWSLKEIKVANYLRRTPGQQYSELSKRNNKALILEKA